MIHNTLTFSITPHPSLHIFSRQCHFPILQLIFYPKFLHQEFTLPTILHIVLQHCNLLSPSPICSLLAPLVPFCTTLFPFSPFLNFLHPNLELLPHPLWLPTASYTILVVLTQAFFTLLFHSPPTSTACSRLGLAKRSCINLFAHPFCHSAFSSPAVHSPPIYYQTQSQQIFKSFHLPMHFPLFTHSLSNHCCVNFPCTREHSSALHLGMATKCWVFMVVM